MSEQPEGVDQQLDAGVSDQQAVAPGSDAAADADPAGDRDAFARAVQERAEEAGAVEPPD